MRRGIPGAFAECGVWRGGSVLVMVLTLQELGVDDRDIYLYDTFEGMTPPTERDTSRVDNSGMEYWRQAEESGTRAFPHFFDESMFTEDGVRALLLSTGYPPTACTSFAAGSRTRSPRPRRTRSRCCVSTRTGTSRRATSSCTSTPA